MLIATVPGDPRRDQEQLRKILGHPYINAIRINTGVSSPDTPYETLAYFKGMTDKEIWIDLKCRQLRVTEWCVPRYSEIVLNHEIEVDLPAQIHLRGAGWHEISRVEGNKVWLKNPPTVAIGKGQSVNIRGNNFDVKGFWSGDDLAYIRAAQNLGINRFMLSFYWGIEDLKKLEAELEFPGQNYVGLKIEDGKGLATLSDFPRRHNVCAVVARDDLLISLGDQAADLPYHTQRCLARDPDAIVASQFFTGIERSGVPSAADFSDLEFLIGLGCGKFMLQDDICMDHFDALATHWKHHLSERGQSLVCLRTEQ